MSYTICNRRRFVQGAATAVTAMALGTDTARSADTVAQSADNAGRIFKSVKWGMVREGGSILEKFQLQKDLGFDGVELNSPSGLDKDEVIQASRETGMPIHGVVDSVHWKQRLSSPDENVRANGLAALFTALEDTYHYGGNAVLLVPGQVTGADENHDQVWQRSISEIRKVLPLAARLGVRVLIENVWNGFCEKPELLRDYIDEIASPWVGVYFDIGNVRKFGPSEDWIRVLRHRIVKLDVKEWSVAREFGAPIGEGDVNWSEVRKALAEIEFCGWCTAEVRGGDRERLRDIAARMNKELALG